MAPDNKDDGYEENPWTDDPPGELVRIKDFLPPPEAFAQASVKLVPDEAGLSPEDVKLIEKQAVEHGKTLSGFIASLLHDYASGELVKRS